LGIYRSVIVEDDGSSRDRDVCEQQWDRDREADQSKNENRVILCSTNLHSVERLEEEDQDADECRDECPNAEVMGLDRGSVSKDADGLDHNGTLQRAVSHFATQLR
jgi:hypothetical protein